MKQRHAKILFLFILFFVEIFCVNSKDFLACSPLSCSDQRLAASCLRPDYIKVITSKKFKRESESGNVDQDLSLEHYMTAYPEKTWHGNLLCLRSFCLFGCNTDDCEKSEELVKYCHLMCKSDGIKHCKKKKA